jgi:hypothetical protein
LEPVVPFSKQSYDPETLAILKEAFDMAWEELKLVPGLHVSEDLRNDLAIRVIESANHGVLDPLQIKDQMLREFAPRQP